LLKELREMPRWETAVLGAAVVLMAAWTAGQEMRARPGRIVVNVVPADAMVMIDNVKVGTGSRTVERLPGPYTLSITRDGYSRSDQNIEVRRDHAVTLNVTLEPSPDTGFELTSDPPGALVWLDGLPVRDGSGEPARSNFRASRMAESWPLPCNCRMLPATLAMSSSRNEAATVLRSAACGTDRACLHGKCGRRGHIRRSGFGDVRSAGADQ